MGCFVFVFDSHVELIGDGGCGVKMNGLYSMEPSVYRLHPKGLEATDKASQNVETCCCPKLPFPSSARQ